MPSNEIRGVRIGADVGGTFTDVVVEFPDGSFESTKVLTTSDAPERGILSGIAEVAESAGIQLSDVSQVLHGTTLATNALIERNGAKTALVTTEGFRDVIETRTESRFEQYDLNIQLPPPLIERADRFVVSERLDAKGQTLIPFDVHSANRAIADIAARGYESVAVGFLHSYRNASNERRFRELLAEELPHIAISISSEVSPQMREYERFNTACVNAYIQPLMANYLVRLRDQLNERGARCPLYMIHSGGGLISVETAANFPVRLVESGPAGGAIFAANLAAKYRRDRVLAYDMGGTTAKISLIENFNPQTAKTFEVDRSARFKKGSGMPISIPVIEMIEIGAGGGSIASVNSLDQIRIGPQSAGSEPGPAAYARGGTDATVTDANVQLGRLHPDTFGATDIVLSPSLASEAISNSIGRRLNLDAETGAVGIAEVVDENMANAARVHAVENGKDLAGYSLIAFGGGAPLHAARLMDKLGLNELIVPSGAGVGSAIGFLRAPFSYEAVRSFYTTTAALDYVGANLMLAELEQEAITFVREGTNADVTVQRQVSMRYAGQGWEIPVPLDDGVFDQFAAQLLAAKFTKVYEEFFGRAIEGLSIEAVSWAVRVASVSEEPTSIPILSEPNVDYRSLQSKSGTTVATRSLYDPATGSRVDAAVLRRADLSPGDGLVGPAIIVEPQTTTIVGSNHRCVMQNDRSLVVSRRTSISLAGELL